jgi:formate/nitrite transporter
MSFNTPEQVTAAAVETGAKRAFLTPDKMLVGGFLAGAYIAFGGLLSMAVSSGLDPKTWGTLPTLFSGAVFSVGLMLCILAGSELLTGNMATLPIAALRRRISVGRVGIGFLLVLIGNVLGSLFVAYFLSVKAGVIGTPKSPAGTPPLLIYEKLKTIATLKALTETDWQIFLRAVGCNWLVCLAVWLALSANDTAGKILGIFFPILAFVAIGFDHVVANMFFLPAAIFANVPGIGWGDVLNNWLFAFLGNLVGAAVFVSTAYWFMYLRGTPDEAAADREPVGQPGAESRLAPARRR